MFVFELVVTTLLAPPDIRSVVVSLSLRLVAASYVLIIENRTFYHPGSYLPCGFRRLSFSPTT